MTRNNREWKSFSQRWHQSSYLTGFYGWSGLCHVFLILLIVAPIYLARQEIRKETEEQAEKQLAETKEKAKIEKQVEEELEDQLKEELVDEELKKLYEELTKDFLDKELALAYWDELMVEMEEELAELVEMFEPDQEFDPVQVEEKLIEIKQEMVFKLEDIAKKKALEPVKQEWTEQTKKLAEEFVRATKKGLEEKVGESVGTGLKLALEREMKSEAVVLLRAWDYLDQAEKEAKTLLPLLKKSEKEFTDQNDKQLQLAKNPKSDANEDKALANLTKTTRAQLLAATRHFNAIRSKAGIAANQLKPYLPKQSDNLKADDISKGATAIQKAMASAATRKLPDTVKHVMTGQDKTELSLKAIQEAKQAIKAKLAGQKKEALKNNALVQKLNEINSKKITPHVENQLAGLIKEKALPTLEKNLKTALGKQFPGDDAKNKAMKAELEKTLKKILGKELGSLKEPGKEFEKGVHKHLPHTASKDSQPQSHSPSVLNASGKAQVAALATTDRKLTEVIQGALGKATRTQLLMGRATTQTKPAAFLGRLASIRNQLSAQRKDVLGTPGTSKLLVLRSHYQNKQNSLSRLGGLRMDMKAYRKMVEAIKDRGHITGKAWIFTATTGETNKSEEVAVWQPSFVTGAPNTTPDRKKQNKDRKVKQPEFKTHRFAGIPFLAKDTIKLDGKLDDWQNIQAISLDPVVRGGTIAPLLKKPKTQTGYLAFTSEGLLLAVRVVDTSGKLEDHHSVNSFWLNDGVEIYLDTLNTKYDKRGEPNTHQFFVFPFGQKEDRETGGYESYFFLENQRIQWKKVAYPKNVIRRAAQKTADGWTLEVLIPKAILRHGKIVPGRIIGFNLQIDSGTNLYYFWTCAEQVRTSMHPDTWGDIQFLGSDAEIELVHRDGKDKLTSLIPGQTVGVRVSDPDMNLDAKTRDKISVTIRAGNGDFESLILEETEMQSGIFLGSVATKLNLGKATPGVLELYEGETITVEYIDQARAFGERNVPVRAKFSASTSGATLSAN